MARNPQIQADLVLRLQNLDRLLKEVKNKVGQIKMPDLQFSSQTTQNFVGFIRALSSAGPQLQAGARHINAFTSSIEGSLRTLNRAAPGLKAFASAMNAVTASARQQRAVQEKQLTLTEDLGRQTAITVRRFSGFLIARDLIFGLGFAFRDTIAEAVRFEREITKIAQLQNSSIASARQLGSFIGGLSTQYGASSSELVKAGQVLAQAGKTSSETRLILSGLAQASLAPTFGTDTQKNADNLIALLGQFKLEAKDTAAVLDILNAVSKDYNVSVEELFEGVRRAGSTFAVLSGVPQGLKPGLESLKEFTALFTSVIDTTRESAETIGTSFRTVLPRLLRGSTRDLIKKELGLDLLDDTGKFIGPFKAIEGLFKSLQNFRGSDSTFARIIEEFGGSRQVGRVIPLLQEFPKAMRAFEIANNSAGSVVQDSRLAYETLGVQLDRLKEQFLALGRDFVNSGSFKVLADSFLIAAKSAASLVKALEPLLPLITALAAVSAAKSTFSFGKEFLYDGAFHLPPLKRAGGGNVGRVDSLLTPGELVFNAASARANGQSALSRFNATGDISALRTMRGVQMVPGVGNTDSVHAKLEPGSYVIRKSSVQKALGFRRFASGGNVGSPQSFFSDPQFSEALQVFANEVTSAGGTIDDLKRVVDKLTRSGVKNLEQAIDYLAKKSIAIQRRFSPQNDSRFAIEGTILRGGGATAGNLNDILQSKGVFPQKALALDFVAELKRLGIAARDYRAQLVDIIKSSKTVVEAQTKFAFLLAKDPRFIRGGFHNASLSRDFTLVGQARSPITLPSKFQKALPYYPRAPITDPARLLPSPESVIASSIQADNSFRMVDLRNSGRFYETKFGSRRPGRFNEFGGAASRLASRFKLPQFSLPNIPYSLGKAFSPLQNLPQGFGGGASIVSLLLGGSISSSARTATEAGLGGALSGGGIGFQAGSFGGPAGAAIGTFVGAIVGATSSVKSFSQATQDAATQTSVAKFVAGGKNAAELSADLSARAAVFRNITPTSNNLASRFLVGGPKDINVSRTSAFTRASFLSQLSSLGSVSAGFVTNNRVGNTKAIDSLIARQISSETEGLQSKFEPAIERLTSDLQSQVISKIEKGGQLNVNDIVNKLTSDQLRILAVGNKSFQGSDLADEKRLNQLGRGAAIRAVQDQINASRGAIELAEALRKAAQSSTLLNDAFAKVDAGLRSTAISLANEDNKISRITNPGQLIVNQKLNPFSDVRGIKQSTISSEISSIVREFGIKTSSGRLAADSAELFANITNNLPKALNDAAIQNPNDTISGTLSKILGSANVDPRVLSNLNDNINSLFSGDRDVTLNNLDPQKIEQIVSQLASTLQEGSEIFRDVFDLREQAAARRAAAINQRTQLGITVAQSRIGANALFDQQIDTGREILGLPGITASQARSRVNRDVRSLTGGATSPDAIFRAITDLQRGGITEGEVDQFARLQEALKLLSSDTRVLDATMKKNNDLQRAASGSRSFLERSLQGPDEIGRINQEIRDLIEISRGGNIGGPRAGAAINTGRQLLETFTEDQLSNLGIQKSSLDKILAQQAGQFFAPGSSKQIAGIIGKNLLPNQAIAEQAQGAIDVQFRAAEAMRELDKTRLEEMTSAIQNQSAALSAAINSAFASEPVVKLTDTLQAFSNGSKLSLDGQVNLVISSNGLNGVLNGIQDDLKTFIGNVVTEQLKATLQTRIAGANTA